MIRRQPNCSYLLAVESRTITLVIVPAIMRMFVMQAQHIFITVGLGKNAGRRYSGINGIPSDNTLVNDTKIRRKNMAVDQQEVWTNR